MKQHLFYSPVFHKLADIEGAVWPAVLAGAVEHVVDKVSLVGGQGRVRQFAHAVHLVVLPRALVRDAGHVDVGPLPGPLYRAGLGLDTITLWARETIKLFKYHVYFETFDDNPFNQSIV